MYCVILACFSCWFNGTQNNCLRKTAILESNNNNESYATITKMWDSNIHVKSNKCSSFCGDTYACDNYLLKVAIRDTLKNNDKTLLFTFCISFFHISCLVCWEYMMLEQMRATCKRWGVRWSRNYVKPIRLSGGSCARKQWSWWRRGTKPSLPPKALTADPWRVTDFTANA